MENTQNFKTDKKQSQCNDYLTMMATRRHESKEDSKTRLKVGMNVRSKEVPENVRLREIPDLNAPELFVADFFVFDR